MNSAATVVVPRSAWKFLVCVWAMLFAGCAASQTEVRSDPQILQVQQYLNAWAGEYYGRVDHGRWYLSTGSTVDRVPPSHNLNTDGWQWERELGLDLTIRFTPGERGGQLRLSLSPVDTFQVQSWNLSPSFSKIVEDSTRRYLERQPLEFDFSIPRDILLLDERKLAGSWGEEKSSTSLEETIWSHEKKVEFEFERVPEGVSGVLRYYSKAQHTGEYRSEEKHEMKMIMTQQ